jgi:predicted RecB family endonuclease
MTQYVISQEALDAAISRQVQAAIQPLNLRIQNLQQHNSTIEQQFGAWRTATDATISTLEARNNRLERALDASAARSQDMIDRIKVGEYVGTGDRILSDFLDCIVAIPTQ